jgi:hypothetical protein
MEPILGLMMNWIEYCIRFQCPGDLGRISHLRSVLEDFKFDVFVPEFKGITAQDTVLRRLHAWLAVFADMKRFASCYGCWSRGALEIFGGWNVGLYSRSGVSGSG